MISELKIGQKIHAAFLVRIGKIGVSSNGKNFARGLLEDASGQIGFICFDQDAVEKLRLVEQPVPFMIAGSVDANNFNGDTKLQILLQKVSDLMPEDDISHLLPKGDFDRDAYETELKRYMGMIKQPVLKTLVDNLLQGALYKQFLENPAGMRLHHAYIGGLLQHSVNVTRLAVAMADAIGDMDKDLIIAGALLHDIGKVREISSDMGFPYTTEGRLVGHITMSVLMVQQQADALKMPSSTLEQLMHILLSHHGNRENGSPVECETKEAFVVHYADELDATINQFKPVREDTWSYNKMLQRYILDRKK